MAEVLVGGVKFEMEERDCINCGRKFKTSNLSEQFACSVQCGPNGTGLKPGWRKAQAARLAEVHERRKLETKQMKARIAALKVDEKLERVEANKVVTAIAEQNQAVTEPVDYLTPTEEEVVQSKQQEKWDAAVKRARNLVTSIASQRTEIVELAISVCDIVHGGGRHWRNFEHTYTLLKFAKDIGMKYKTLHGWVQTYKLLKEHLPNEPIDWSAGKRTLDRTRGMDTEEVKKEYEFQLKRNGTPFRVFQIIRNVRWALNVFGLQDLSNVPRKDIEELRDNLNMLLVLVEDSLDSTKSSQKAD